ncbi:MAG TPA: hypothetical protein VL947_03930 [Cytophagales bacterium]|nr:hypothetical protein [Cytophagales bacterium]
MILFNELKHHLGSIAKLIKSHTPGTSPNLTRLGDSLMDLYVGDLDLGAIFHETITFLNTNQISTEEAYRHYLQQHGGHVTYQLSDQSTWVLLLGNEPSLYVHIHPARYSLHTLRVKSSTLKTAILLKIHQVEVSDLKAVNMIRKQLQLSPIKSMELSHNINHVLHALQKFC